MTFDVSDEAKQAATRCKKDFSCLKGDRDCLCTVERVVGGQVFFVSCQQQNHCPYKHRYGFADFFCACPVRKEIYNKYKL